MELREPSARYLVRSTNKRSEVGVIPDDWNVYPLADLTDANRPISYGIVQTGPSVQNGVRCLRVLDVENGRINKSDLITTTREISAAYKRTILKAGDLVMPLRGKVGDVGIIDEDLSGSNLTRGVALIAIRSDWSGQFCRHFIAAPGTRARMEQSMNGSALQEIPIAALRAFKIALPPTKAEQEAIAEALSDADALIESLDQLIAKKRDLKHGAMQELLTGKKRLPGFSGEWVVKPLGEIAQPRRERVDPRVMGEYEFCIELEHIGQGTGDLVGHTVAGEGSSLKSVFAQDDVLFGKLRAYLRKYWLASRAGVCSTEIWALVAKRSLLIPSFLFQLVQTEHFIDAASSSYGTHMPRSDWNVVKSCKVSLPSIDEQTAIASILSDMDTELAELQSRLAKAREIKQGMMQELLTGRIRLL